jgi:hypothetical protein
LRTRPWAKSHKYQLFCLLLSRVKIKIGIIWKKSWIAQLACKAKGTSLRLSIL